MARMTRFGLCASALAMVCFAVADPKRIVGYYTDWSIGRGYEVAEIPGNRIDVVNYAFATLNADYTVSPSSVYNATQRPLASDDLSLPFRGNYNQLYVLRKNYPHIKALISIQGTASRFSALASTSSGRSTFSTSLKNFLVTYKFDGVDIDWEFPVSSTGNAADKHNFTLLMQQIRDDMNVQSVLDGKRYFLTAAVSGGYPNVADLEVGLLLQECDWLNFMGYDYAGLWSNTTGHLAPLYGRYGANSTSDKWCIHYCLNTYQTAGGNLGQFTLGVPFYARGWRDVPSTGNGLRQTGSGGSPGTWGTGTYGYADVVSLPGTNGYVRYWDATQQAAYLYSPTHNNGTFITYEDLSAIATKSAYVNSRNMGGLMTWELSGDTTGSNSLLTAMAVGLNPYTIAPVAEAIVLGRPGIGSIENLELSDSANRVLQGVVAQAPDAPYARVEFSATANTKNPQEVRFRLKHFTTARNATFRIEFWDYTTNQYVPVQDGTVNGFVTQVEPIGSNPTRFVSLFTGQMKVRVTYKTSRKNTTGDVWIDQAIWLLKRQ